MRLIVVRSIRAAYRSALYSCGLLSIFVLFFFAVTCRQLFSRVICAACYQSLRIVPLKLYVRTSAAPAIDRYPCRRRNTGASAMARLLYMLKTDKNITINTGAAHRKRCKFLKVVAVSA